ncbi:hypothetical protein Gocc_2901 [Gaiella occulta]|uniref:Uncharacterized protein n=1 Tax=Gaiella occulta TaxID=1002870 RepID=A0A7M2YT11_9ACTN|nr:hypothetical protein [Gaiella occulta]RDI73301.1 hypothetical protein Gocc_2901 [Gaiella occulta]
MDDLTGTPRTVSSGEELVDVLQASYGLTREQAERQARLVEGKWANDLHGARPHVDPEDWLPKPAA